jgi:hypothetical protein
MSRELVEFSVDRVSPLGVPMALVEGKCLSKVPWDSESVHMDRADAQRAVGTVAKCLPWRVMFPVAVGKRSVVPRVGLWLPVSVAKDSKSVVNFSQECSVAVERVYGSPVSHDVDDGVEHCRLCWHVDEGRVRSSGEGGRRMCVTSASRHNGRIMSGTNGVVPVRVVSEGVVKHTWVPWGVGCEMDVWK